jgi:F-type H+-transporting ATPase subunit b
MITKKILIFIVIAITITTKSIGAEESGMPQLNPEYWISQIFWLIIVFSSLYIFLSKLVLPKISENLEKRKSQVLSYLEQAEKFKKESEKKIKEYETIILESKNKAELIINASKEKLSNEISLKKNQLDEEIEKEINLAEKEIENLKKDSIININKIAVETTTEIIKNLMKIELNQSNVSAIVEDVSKKRIDKNI